MPNGSTTTSGAVILNSGHIDVASLIEGGQLVTKIKDSTAGNPAVYRDPANGPGADDPGSQDPSDEDPGADPGTDNPDDNPNDPGSDQPGEDPNEPVQPDDPPGDPGSQPGPDDPDQNDNPDHNDNPDQNGDQAWNVANGTVNRAGATVLNNGHVDIASTLVSGALATKVKDTTVAGQTVWREPGSTVLQLLPGAEERVPPGSQWSFLGPEGSAFYQVAQTQQPNLLWPGWSTEEIPAAALKTGVSWALVGASGPGEFALYQTGTFGQPSVLFSTGDGISAADSFTIPKLTHAHGSWAFNAAGAYCLSMERVTLLDSGATARHAFGLTVAVGQTDVMNLDPGPCDAAARNELGGTAQPPAPNSTDPSASSGSATYAGAPAATTAAAKCKKTATVLSAGHIDYASRIVDGKLESLVGDDTSGAKVYRQPAGVILWLKPSARLTLPSGLEQVGSAGTPVWLVPQTQNADLVWLGWSTEGLNSANARGSVSWTLDKVDGPGRVSVYLSGVFGGVQQVVFPGSAYDIALGVHAHANWAFSAEGIYRLTMTQRVTLASGARSTDTETLTIAVGNVDPLSAASEEAGCGAASAVIAADAVEQVLKSAPQAAALRRAETPADPATANDKTTPNKEATKPDRPAISAAPARSGSPTLILSIGGGLALAGSLILACVYLAKPASTRRTG
ncbi:MAG: TIGR03773 family transporter-associated surface protein, partial [Bifidobacteriaceae bacterium]|nr:TIGR03773 family transporter-associated surface protein [Bifidobacteriaceae bacterium]